MLHSSIIDLIETKPCRYGVISYFKNDSVIGASLREYGEWAQNEIDLLLNLIQPGDTVFDVGAFIGTHTLAFAQKVGQKGCVYSFEPNPFSYEILRLNITQNHLTNVICEKTAFSNTPTVLHFDPSTWDESNPGATSLLDGQEATTTAPPVFEKINVSCLDQLSLSNCGLIKIDVEGMESNILEGGINFINTHRPYIYTECLSVTNGAKYIPFMEKEKYVGFIHSVLAYSPQNFNNNPVNIFELAREVNILMVPDEKIQRFQSNIKNIWGLIPFNTLDDLVLAMVTKPQYKSEVLEKTNAADVLGVEYFLKEGSLDVDPNIIQRIESLTVEIENNKQQILELKSHFDISEKELTSQIKTKEEQIQSLSRQLENTEKEFTSQIKTKEEQIQSLSHQLENTEKELTSQIKIRDEQIQILTSQLENVRSENLAKIEQLTHKHTEELLSKKQTIKSLLSRLSSHHLVLQQKERTIENLETQLADLRQNAESNAQLLSEIMHSRAWKAVETYRKYKIKLLPPGSFRLRFLRGIKNGVRMLFTRGPIPLIKRFVERISELLYRKPTRAAQVAVEVDQIPDAQLLEHPNPMYIPDEMIVPSPDDDHGTTPAPAEPYPMDRLWKLVQNGIKNRNFVISISHDDYLTITGGTQVFIADEQDALDKRGISYIHLYPIREDDYLNNQACIDVGLNVDSTHIGQFPLSAIVNLESLLAEHNYTCLSLNLHHFMGWSISGLKSIISNARAKQLIFYIHDYFSVCPQFILLRNNIEFCNAPDIESHACTICMFSERRKDHLSLVRELFFSFPFQVIAPSRSAKLLWQKAFPFYSGEVRIEPHLIIKESTSLIPVRQDGRIKIAFAGGPHRTKGWEIWRELVDIFSTNDHYKLFHLGARYDVYSEEFVSVKATPNNRNAMTDALRNHEIDVLFHFTLNPETFSFVLYEAIAAGCFILTFVNSGNVADFVRENQNGIVFESKDDLFAYLADPDNLRRDLANFHERHPRLKIVEKNEAIPCLIAKSRMEQ